jgi:hypothetical protein
MAAPSAAAAWVDWAAEYTKAAQAESRPPAEWAARVASVVAAAGDAPWSPGLAEMLARALLYGGGGAAWKYAEAALAAGLASPALLLAILSTRYGRRGAPAPIHCPPPTRAQWRLCARAGRDEFACVVSDMGSCSRGVYCLMESAQSRSDQATSFDL